MTVWEAKLRLVVASTTPRADRTTPTVLPTEACKLESGVSMTPMAQGKAAPPVCTPSIRPLKAGLPKASYTGVPRRAPMAGRLGDTRMSARRGEGAGKTPRLVEGLMRAATGSRTPAER